MTTPDSGKIPGAWTVLLKQRQAEGPWPPAGKITPSC